MKLHSSVPFGNTVTAYGEGFIAINGERHERATCPSLLLRPQEIDSGWRVESFSELTADDFVRLANLGCDVIILGTGRRQHFPAPALLRPLIEAGRGIEVMDTYAACRTYNILMAEGRAVAAALIIE